MTSQSKSAFPDFSSRYRDWPVRPARYFLRQKKVTVGDEWGETQLLSLTKAGVIERDIDSGVGKYPASFEGYQVVEPGDLVFCLFDVEETPRTVGRVKNKGMITAAYTAYEVDTDKADPRFLEYLFISLDDEKRYKPFYSGLRNTVPKNVLTASRFSLPSLAEQKAIADYLDTELRKLDDLVAKQRSLIPLIAERKQAVIDGGMESPNIAHGSRQTKVKYQAELNPSVSKSLRANQDILVSFMPMEALSEDGVIDVSALRSASELIGSYSYFEPGDVLVAKVTPCFENGKGAPVTEAANGFGFGTTEVSVFRPKDQAKLTPEFLYFVTMTSTFRRGGAAHMTGAGGLKRVPESYMQNFEFPLPTVENQVQIVQEIKTKLAELNRIAKASEDTIKLLLERRQALISSTVTGKIDVRGRN